ncbi:MAG: FAD-dependent oxidoreductase [Actinobacteria bacterium]|nr:FAD-dependent oxidoreductase [Actinomycetota bacterium]MCG2818880.1 FAD-dependent oxidoreductase [Actinomycetes bacterium]MBU4218781.1 FAD-dependent oxidoreductase [Actinomycetota bacterium]MBU4357784.1 FAD-dependent oxidoreductase [Actinomycetota bacterium]MBU4390899.1 FAD-dependent oxidoreductase [Actinomycetota bacterium]
MVVGGGIGGIQASLDLVEMGYRVYLVDSGPSIGGVMGQLDKTFPTNDCSMCILSPKLVEVGSSENIELFTLSDVVGVEGEEGDFTVELRVRPRFVDPEKCTGCGICTEQCRVKVKDPYDADLKRTPLIRVPFPQAVPGVAFIDPTRCLYLLKGKCGECKEVCLADAVDFEQKERTDTLRVGSIVMAPGYRPFDARIKAEYGYGVYDNVVTSLEFERILAANGPTGGHVLRRSDGGPVRKLAFIQCVGSRDTSVGNSYCSSVCCMYATKQSLIAREHQRDIEPSIFFIDMRSYGKGFEEYYRKASREQGVRYVRCLASYAKELRPSGNILIGYTDEDGNAVEEEFDLVVLSVGIEPDAAGLAGVLGVALGEHGFVATDEFLTVKTSRPGVYACGVVEGPKDIPDTVVQASASADMASAGLGAARGELIVHVEHPPEREVVGEEPRIGAVICRCGTNIGGVVDVPAVVEYARTLPNVVFADERLYACSQDTQEWIRDIVREHGLNRLMVASCTPRTHQPLFRDTMRSAGLNKYLFEMANIREHCSWVHMNLPDEATGKSKHLVKMAVGKAALLEPLQEGVSPVTPRALVIGGGGAGMTAALRLGDAGFTTYLVEKELELGGNMRHIFRTVEGGDVGAYLEELVGKVSSHGNIELFLDSTVDVVDGYVGKFHTTLSTPGGPVEVDHGVVVVATGGVEYEPKEGEYFFGRDERVITQAELERRIHQDPGSLAGVRDVVMIQCVGSRNDENPYCSKICCTVAVKNALALKRLNPDAGVHICYRDVRTYGFAEDRYLEARERGVGFIRFDEDEPPEVKHSFGDLLLKVADRNVRGEEVSLGCDLVVLSTGVAANPDAAELGPKLKVPLSADGFFLEAHVKLRPVDFATDGVFVAGLAHYPKTIGESLTQACAAAARAESVLCKENVVTEGVVAWVDEEVCSGCRQCVRLCSYEAIDFDEERGVAVVNSALCKGCGACTAACTSGANTLLGFKQDQIYAQIEAACNPL